MLILIFCALCAAAMIGSGIDVKNIDLCLAGSVCLILCFMGLRKTARAKRAAKAARNAAVPVAVMPVPSAPVAPSVPSAPSADGITIRQLIDANKAERPAVVTDDEPEQDIDEAFQGLDLDREISREQRKLEYLYSRKDRAEALNADCWERYEKTKAWRGLLWDIERAEDRIAYLERAKA